MKLHRAARHCPKGFSFLHFAKFTKISLTRKFRSCAFSVPKGRHSGSLGRQPQVSGPRDDPPSPGRGDMGSFRVAPIGASEGSCRLVFLGLTPQAIAVPPLSRLRKRNFKTCASGLHVSIVKK
jgi:hypothetical protein